MKIFKRNKKKKTLVVGLDGVPYTMLKNLIEKGHIKNMAKIFNEGFFGDMTVSIPEISSVSWTSFMTGEQSGEHGIYGFIDLEPGTYQIKFPNYSNIKTTTMWERIAEKDKKSIIVNMPSTYPAKKINGCLVSGFVAPDIHKSIYPIKLIDEMKELGYRINVDMIKSQKDNHFLMKDLKETLEKREIAVNYLWDKYEWDLFMVVITGTDRLMHFLWDAYEDESHEYHEQFIEYFELVDEVVGRLHKRLFDENSENNYYMLSDHGFTKIEKEVYLNRWLQENNYLKFSSGIPKSIMEIDKGSSAFVLDPSRVYINLSDKYPYGHVNKNEYEKLCAELIDGFKSLSYEDKQVIQKIFHKEEIYSGPYLDSAPDLVLLSNHGFDLKGRTNSEQVYGKTNLLGMHTQNNAFFYSSNGEKCSNVFEASKIVESSIK